jgi:hypothetical protein
MNARNMTFKAISYEGIYETKNYFFRPVGRLQCNGRLAVPPSK